MWKSEDWDMYSFEYLLLMFRGYRRDRNELWEMCRVQSFYSFVAMNGNKKVKTPQDLFPLASDKKQSDPDITTFTKMTREETFDEYKKNGRVLEDWELDKILKRNGGK
jgi:hypothetical protein